jgi:gamma-glutamyltranspeptidase/glutathione hydrolase
VLIESGKLAFADREAWYGDPHFSEVPIRTLTSSHYASGRRALLGDTASLELRPGSPDGRAPVLPRHMPAREDSASGVGEPTIAATGETRGDTCHIDVVDRTGMMVSATPSGGWLQSSPVIPGLGFPLNTRGQMFWLEPGLPNSLRPGARPRTTLSPSLALRDGEPWLAFGTPGGDAQDQWSLQFFLNLVHGGMGLQEAADAPGFHSMHVPGSFYPHDAHPGRVQVEDRFDPAVLADLRRRGHEIVVEPPWSEGFTMAVARDGDWLKAGVSPRRMGYAVGR